MSKFTLVLLIPLIFCLSFFACAKATMEPSIVVVTILPPYDKTHSPEANYWTWKKSIFPQTAVPDPIPAALPNDDSLLTVKLDRAGALAINTQHVGNINDTTELRHRLEQIFRERGENHVFEVGNNKVVTATALRASRSASYEDVFRVLEAIRNSNADPVMLQIDDLPE